MSAEAPDVARVPVALLCGGRATRLGELAQALPKALVEVAGRPFVEHQLRGFEQAGVRRVVLCVGHLGDQIEERLGDGRALGLELAYSRDGERLLGTAGALQRALPLLGGLFWVVYGDSYAFVDYRAVLASFARSDALALMTVFRNEGRWDRSNVVYRDGRLLRYDKSAPDPASTHIDYGVSLLRAEALDGVPPGAPADLADVFRGLSAQGRLAGFEVTRRFYEIGSPEGLAETRAYLEAGGVP